MNWKLPPELAAVKAVDDLATDYRVDLSPAQAREAMATFNTQCECRPAILRDFIQRVNSTVPPHEYAGDNPNNGQLHHVFMIGREFTRVIYLKIAKLNITLGVRKDYDFFNLGNELLTAAAECHATEYDVVEESEIHLEMRFWWKRCSLCR